MTAVQQFWLMPVAATPTYAFIENFNGGAGDYTLAGGSSSQYAFNSSDTYGASLSYLGGVISAIQTTIIRSVAAVSAVKRVAFKVRIDLNTGGWASPDDGPIMELNSGIVGQLAFNSMREKFYDPNQRPVIAVLGGPGPLSLGSGPLVVGAWYDVDVRIASSSLCTVTVTAVGGAVHSTTNISGAFTSWAIDTFRFYDSSSGGGSSHKPGATFDEIALYLSAS